MKLLTVGIATFLLGAPAPFFPTPSRAADRPDKFISTKPDFAYRTIKALTKMELEEDTDKTQTKPWIENDDGSRTIWFVRCGNTASDGIGIKSSKISSFVDLAGFMIEYDSLMANSGYPASAWAVLTDQFEKQWIKNLASGYSTTQLHAAEKKFLERVFLAKMEEYRKNSGKELPDIQVQGMCGDEAKVAITLETDPPNRRLSLISVFSFKLCRDIGKELKDPGYELDPNRCSEWQDTVASKPEKVAGSYYVRIEWDNKSEPQLTKHNFNGVDEGAKVVFKRPVN